MYVLEVSSEARLSRLYVWVRSVVDGVGFPECPTVIGYFVMAPLLALGISAFLVALPCYVPMCIWLIWEALVSTDRSPGVRLLWGVAGVVGTRLLVSWSFKLWAKASPRFRDRWYQPLARRLAEVVPRVRLMS